MELRIILAGITIIALAIFSLNTQTPTGAAVEDENYAFTLNHLVMQFFGTYNLVFPQNACGQIAEQLYDQIAQIPMDSYDGFSTSGADRLATINFVVNRMQKLGTLDMTKGQELNGDNGGFISINTEAVMRTPKEQRSTFYFMDLNGYQGESFIVMKGIFSTPSVDCKFSNNNCECTTHPISAIRAAGITTIRPQRELP